MSQYFPPYRSCGGDIKVELHLSNYTTKTDLKNVTHVDASSFALKTNLANLKTEVGKIDVDKLKTAPVDLAKLSTVVTNDVVKKAEYNSLKRKVDNIDTTNFVLKTKYEKDGSDFEHKISNIGKKIPDVSSLAKKTDFNAKVTEIEGKIPIIQAPKHCAPDRKQVRIGHPNFTEEPKISGTLLRYVLSYCFLDTSLPYYLSLFLCN